MLGVSTETVKRRERDGLLKSLRFNSRLVRYRREDVERMIESAS
jgi:predicted site-specific integrase-resolvase